MITSRLIRVRTRMTCALVALAIAGQLTAQDAPRRPADRDGDGKISREEFPGPAEIFQRFDTDKDGFIDQKEREAMRGARRQGRVGRGNNGGFAMQEFFRALDTDRDRQVSPKEWEPLLKAAGEPANLPKGRMRDALLLRFPDPQPPYLRHPDSPLRWRWGRQLGPISLAPQPCIPGRCRCPRWLPATG